EAPVFQPRQSAVGAGPQVAVTVFPHGANVVVRQSVLDRVMPQIAAGTSRQEAEAGAHPEIAVTVLEQRDHDISHRPKHGDEAVALQANHSAKTGDINASVASAIDR